MSLQWHLDTTQSYTAHHEKTKKGRIINLASTLGLVGLAPDYVIVQRCSRPSTRCVGIR